MKQITRDNWLEMDEANKHFVAHMDGRIGEIGPLFPDAWLRMVLRPQLVVCVPTSIRDHLEVARATILYGYLYYPLYQLGRAQCHRVADIAIGVKYELEGGKRDAKGRLPSINRRATYLRERGNLLSQEEWNWVREVRNELTHSDQPGAYPPAPTADALDETVERINALFACGDGRP